MYRVDLDSYILSRDYRDRDFVRLYQKFHLISIKTLRTHHDCVNRLPSEVEFLTSIGEFETKS